MIDEKPNTHDYNHAVIKLQMSVERNLFSEKQSNLISKNFVTHIGSIYVILRLNLNFLLVFNS